MKETVTIGSLGDICEVFNEHWSIMCNIKKSMKKTKTGLRLAFVSGLIFGIVTELRIREIQKHLDCTKETNSMQDQLDAQEQKILQLELELEELKKKE